MKRFLPFLLVLLTSPLFAQNTQTSATLTDANGSVIQNCVFTTSLVSSTGQDISTSPVFIGGIPFNDFPVSGNCDAFGHFSVPILSNTSFTAPASPNPAGTQYNFSIQSQASPPNPCPQRAFRGIFTVTGATLDLSAALSALAPVVTCGGPSGPGVTSLKASGFPALQNAITIACGTGLACTQAGQIITIGVTVPFSITSFTGGETVELGFSVVNPAFAATYSVTPASANITNTEGIDSPLTLPTPFTSGTVVGTFTHTAVTTTTFTLSATQGTTQTATQQISWEPRIFSGTGVSGTATGATASGTSAVLVGDTGTLPSFQLGAETIGTTFVFNLTGNYFYMLLIGAGHTFNVNGFPATLASTPVTFVNANGVSVSMNLYVGPTFGTGTYTVVVTG